MINKTKIRFKTRKEFIQEYGNGWRVLPGTFDFKPRMDKYLGREIDYDKIGVKCSQIKNGDIKKNLIELFADPSYNTLSLMVYGGNLIHGGEHYVSMPMLKLISDRPTYNKKKYYE